jgi:hypothetical protein
MKRGAAGGAPYLRPASRIRIAIAPIGMAIPYPARGPVRKGLMG